MFHSGLKDGRTIQASSSGQRLLAARKPARFARNGTNNNGVSLVSPTAAVKPFRYILEIILLQQRQK